MLFPNSVRISIHSPSNNIKRNSEYGMYRKQRDNRVLFTLLNKKKKKQYAKHWNEFITKPSRLKSK